MQSQEKEHTEELEIGTSILTEANEKLKNTLKNKDYNVASIAQALIESAEEKVSNANNLMSDAREKQIKLQKCKQNMINNYFSAVKKKKKDYIYVLYLIYMF